MAVENIYLYSISQSANDKSILLEGVHNQKGCDSDININVEKSREWLANSWLNHSGHQTNGVSNLTLDNYMYHNMFNMQLYRVNKISWLVAQPKILDSNYLNFSCHEGSTAGRAAFIMKNSIKNSDINTKMSQVYSQVNMDGTQGEYSQEYDTKPSNMCLCDSQYVYGKNTKINICCTQQSAHDCQVSNSSLDTQRSVPSLSGNFLRSSANLGKSYNLCTDGCIDCIHGNVSAICCCQEYFTSYVNVIKTPQNLAACHSDDTQYLYSKQEQSFSDKSNFNCYSYVS